MKLRRLGPFLGILLLAWGGVSQAQAQAVLRITEVMSNGDLTDWFEVTNFGNAAANISNYRMDDNSFSITSSLPLNGITSIAPGESVIFIETTNTLRTTYTNDAGVVAAFRNFWGGLPGVQVGYYTGSGVSLSGTSGDGVTLFSNTAANGGSELSGPFGGLIRVSFGAATTTTTFSFRWSYLSTGAANGGVAISSFGDAHGAFTSTYTDACTGSPGRVVRPAALQFTSQPPEYAKVGSVFSYPFAFLTSNPNETGGVTPALRPSWLTNFSITASGGSISGAPSTNDVGTNNAVILRLVGTNRVVTNLIVGGVTNTVTNTVTTTNDQSFNLTVFPASSPVILNEYNAVSGNNTLDISAQSKKAGLDTRLGAVTGNGGNWLELVVVGNGTEGSTVNLQGWQIEISDISNGTRTTDTLTLSSSPAWAAVPAGTILTFIENNAAAGGYDSGWNLEDRRATSGWTWSNVWMGDTNLISSRVWADGVGVSTLSDNQTQIVLKNAAGVLMQGPCGEGISPAGDGLVTSKEVLALQRDPTPGVVPYDSAYVDSMQSSFGKPNPFVNSSTGRTTGVQSFFGKISPMFTVLPATTAIVGQRYGGTSILQNNIEMYIVNFDELQFLVRQKNGAPLPAWLSWEQDYEYVNLSGTPTPANIGVLELELVAKSVSTGAETVQPLTIQVLSATSPVLLNEYNAVAAGNTIGDGLGSDTFFGATADANGGPWFELVVVGDGTTNTVNMTGWKIEIDDAASLPFSPDETLVLSDDPYWAAVPRGTILTFGSQTTVQGGLDTWINKTSRLGQATRPYLWSHIHIGDPYYINQTDTNNTVGGNLAISSGNTQFRVRDRSNNIVAGPFGEGIKTLPGVSSTEVFRLTNEPTPSVTPLDGGYVDGIQSTFGAPNTNQTFSAFKTSNSAPTFTNQPTKFAVEGQAYSWTAATADAENNSVTVTKVSGPAWLSVSGKTLSGTPPQGAAGFYDLALAASDGTASTPLQFRLTVCNDNPSMILNEYNAVDNSGASSKFLNGGDLLANGDGSTPVAVDTRFGRVAGNGGDWVEFVVTGTGSAGTTDLRGWTIEIDEGAGSGYFTAKVKIKLSTASYWAAVPNGTILTFTENNTAQGGMDTNLNGADNSTSSGWRWANVWVGDATLVTYTDEVTNGYTLLAGVVNGINIDDTETQFRVLNASGYPVFGPAGEGIAPVAKISNIDVLELEGHPTASVLPTDRSDDTVTPPKNGYDNSTKGSTFGAPNEWHFGNGGDLTVQNFSAYVVAAGPYDATFGSWASAAGQGSIALTNDADGNGLTALLEYAYGAAAPGSISRNLLPVSSTTNSGGTNQLVLTYFTRTNGVTLAPEVSTSLATNGWGTNGISNTLVGTVTTNNTTLQQRRASVTMDNTNTRKFLRLKATSP